MEISVEEIMLRYVAFLNVYAKSDCSQLEKYLTEKSKRISFWSLTDIVGKDELMKYFKGKANAFKETGTNPKCIIVKEIFGNGICGDICGGMISVTNEQNVLVRLYFDENKNIKQISNEVVWGDRMYETLLEI